MLHEIDLSRVDLNLLVLFEAILAEGSVARAAGRLNLSPSAVSHGLGRLRRLLNDPLFLKTPKGVVPTARALALAEPVADILTRMRQVVASAEPFDPARSRRRFTLAVVDGVAGVMVPALLADLARTAPGIDLSIVGTMPQTALEELDARAADIALQPMEALPPRFAWARLYVEQFGIAMRRGHPLGKAFTLEQYAAESHVLVSARGDPHGNVDLSLAEHGLKRRVALVAPNFLFAMAVVGETDLIAAAPLRQLRANADRFGLDVAEAPLPWGLSEIRAITPKAALMDDGVAWLFERIKAVAPRG